MEKAGYKKTETNTEYVFHKYGEKQGIVSKDLINQKTERDKMLYSNTAKIKALIHKYSAYHSAAIVIKDSPSHTTAPKVFHSELTDYLHKNLGLEFIFFAAKDHKQPYGYTIIDHKNTTVYKGSEIIPLKQLQELQTQLTDKQQENTSFKKDDYSYSEKPNKPTADELTDINEPVSENLSDTWEAIIDTALKDNEAYFSKTNKRKTKTNKSGRSR
jgi:hypothetical protein